MYLEIVKKYLMYNRKYMRVKVKDSLYKYNIISGIRNEFRHAGINDVLVEFDDINTVLIYRR